MFLEFFNLPKAFLRIVPVSIVDHGIDGVMLTFGIGTAIHCFIAFGVDAVASMVLSLISPANFPDTLYC